MKELGLYQEIPNLRMSKELVLRQTAEDFGRKGYVDQARVLAHYLDRIHFVDQVPSDLEGSTGLFTAEKDKGFNIYIDFNQSLPGIMSDLFHESTHWYDVLYETQYFRREIFREFHAWKKTLEYGAENCNLTPQEFFQKIWTPLYIQNKNSKI